MTKKCPACNSTKYKKIEEDFKCARCGFTNKSNKSLKKHLQKNNPKTTNLQ